MIRKIVCLILVVCLLVIATEAFAAGQGGGGGIGKQQVAPTAPTPKIGQGPYKPDMSRMVLP